MKKFLITFFLFAVSLSFAQSEQQSIELPDFVITGRQNINVPIAVKKKPDFISTLSKEFFTPQFAPEELPLLISSEPVPVIPPIKSFNDYFDGSLKVMVGRYSLPVGELHLSQSFNNYLFSANVWGSNIKEYIPYAGYNNSGIELSNEIFISTRSDLFSGARIKLAAEYSRDSYRFYASKTPSFLRETNGGSALFSIASSYNRWINYDFNLRGNTRSFPENGFKETNFGAKGLFEFKQGNFTLGVNGFYTKQVLVNSLSNIDSYNYFSTRGYLKMYPTGLFNFTVGFNYASNSSNAFFAPFGLIEYKFYEGLTIRAEFNPHVKYFTVADFIKRNLYFNFGLSDNVFLKYKTDINGTIQYEYEKLFSVSFTGGYSKMNNYFYFDDALNAGKFDLLVLTEANILSGRFNFVFYPAQLGYLFGELEFKNLKDQFGNFVPYQPKVSALVTYGYDFNSGVGFKVRYRLAYDVYTNILNSDRLKNYNNISLSLSYEIINGLKVTADFQNILDRTNFVWKQYQEKPFDLLMGIEYRW